MRDEEPLGISLPWLLALFCHCEKRGESDCMIGTPFAGYATSSTLPDNFDSYPSNTSVMSANNHFRGDARCDPRGIHVIRRSMKLYILYPLQINNNNESR